MNLVNAIKLYDLIGKYIPEQFPDEHIINFIGRIVDNVVEDESTAYIDVICFLSGKSLEEVLLLESEKRLELFSKGLVINNISVLKEFCEGIGYGKTRES
jgi:hypothetical protein